MNRAAIAVALVLAAILTVPPGAGANVRRVGEWGVGEPAARVTFAAATATERPEAGEASAASVADDDDDAGDPDLAVIALLVGGLALLAVVAGMLAGRRAGGS